jgi:hypothetical protein
VFFVLDSTLGGGTFQVQIGSILSDTLKAPVTYSALTTKTVSTTLHLPQGDQILRFTVLNTPLFNFDKMRFELLTGTANVKNEKCDFLVYPESGRNSYIVELKGEKYTSPLNLYDISGRVLISFQNPGNITRIPVSILNPGVYFIRATINHDPVVKKFMLE